MQRDDLDPIGLDADQPIIQSNGLLPLGSNASFSCSRSPPWIFILSQKLKKTYNYKVITALNNIWENLSMFHVKQLANWIENRKIHEVMFYVFLFLIPIQLRVLYSPETAYISWYFNYHLGFFVYLSDLVLILCFITWFLLDKPKDIWKSSILWPTLAFLALLVIPLFHVKHNLTFVWYETFKWAELFILVLYVEHTFKTRLQYLISFTTLFIAALVQALLAIAQFHVQHGIGLNWLGEYVSPLGTPGLATMSFGAEKIIRAYGTMPHPNVLGGFLVFGLILGIFLATSAKNQLWKLFVSCGTVFISLGIFLTFSRMAWLAAVITVLAYVAYYLFHAKQKNKIWLTLALTIVSCGTVFALWSSYLLNRTANIDPASISSRGMFNNMSMELVKQNLIFGTGQGNYIQSLEQMFHMEPWQYQPAHNIFLVIAVQFGLLGLGLFVKLLYETFRRVKKLRHETIAWVICFTVVTFIIMGQVDHYFVTIQQGRLVFFLLLGFTAALPNLNHETTD
jgi:putative inorganic carbon (HCO3(-)) transporter